MWYQLLNEEKIYWYFCLKESISRHLLDQWEKSFVFSQVTRSANQRCEKWHCSRRRCVLGLITADWTRLKMSALLKNCLSWRRQISIKSYLSSSMMQRVDSLEICWRFKMVCYLCNRFSLSLNMHSISHLSLSLTVHSISQIFYLSCALFSLASRSFFFSSPSFSFFHPNHYFHP